MIAIIVRFVKLVFVHMFMLVGLSAFAEPPDYGTPIDFGTSSLGSRQQPAAADGRRYTPEQARLISQRNGVGTTGASAVPNTNTCAAAMFSCPDGTSVPLRSENNCAPQCSGSGTGAQTMPWQGYVGRRAGNGARPNRVSFADSGNMTATTTNSHYVGGVSFDVSPTMVNVDNSTHTNNNLNNATVSPVITSNSNSQGSAQSGAVSGDGNGGKCSKTGAAAKGAAAGSSGGWWGALAGAVAGYVSCM